jgi:hypothetical protein
MSTKRPQGGWPYPFDKKAKPADFVSYNAVLALAEAGHRPETDEHLDRAVKAMLAAQRPEGSWEGDPVYQGFNTPFRATQFAVMALVHALSRHHQSQELGCGLRAPPTVLAKNDLPLLLQQLDQFWDLAPEPVLQQIRAVLTDSDQPLAREAAARALGHMADPGADACSYQGPRRPTKMVQAASAYALRMILSRRQDAAPEGRKMLAAALGSPDARAPAGARRASSISTSAISPSIRNCSPLWSATLNDPVPYVRFEAAGGVWRWYYWQVDKPDMRRGTLEALATRLNTETDPMVRRGLQESVYDLLDENTGYLSAWVRASAKDEDKTASIRAMKLVVRDQAQVLAKVLREGTPLGREGILNALWDFHIRHYALPDSSRQTPSPSACPRCSPSTSPACPICIAPATSTRPIAKPSTSNTTCTTASSRPASATTAI